MEETEKIDWNTVMTEALQKANWSDKGVSVSHLFGGEQEYWITVSLRRLDLSDPEE